MGTEIATDGLSASRGAANRRKGHEAERNVARYLRAHGFPHAERAVRTGYATPTRTVADPLDITGTPGIVWSIKNTSRTDLPAWLDEADAARVAAGADLAVLVCKQRGKASPAHWWAWVPLRALVPAVLGTGMHDFSGYACMTLDELLPNLHRAGYGEMPDEVSA